MHLEGRTTRTAVPVTTRALGALAAAAVVLAISGCSEAKRYDIAPVFPLSADKCAKYHGDQKGEGPMASCLVTKAECERAVADWRQAMQDGYVDDAIQFICD